MSCCGAWTCHKPWRPANLTRSHHGLDRSSAGTTCPVSAETAASDVNVHGKAITRCFACIVWSVVVPPVARGSSLFKEKPSW